MKNKKLLYVLIPATLLVWGMIIYRIFAAVGEDASVPLRPGPAGGSIAERRNDTFSIDGVYRDPFLGELREKKDVAQPPARKEAKVKEIPAASAAWPAVVYGGIIRNQSSKKQLALVTINGQSNMMKVGDVVDGIALLKVSKDEIVVRFGKESRTIAK